MQANVFAGGSGAIFIVVGMPLENAAVSYILDSSLVSMGLKSNYWGTFAGSALLPIAIYQNDPRFFYGKSSWWFVFQIIGLQLLGGYLGHEIIK